MVMSQGQLSECIARIVIYRCGGKGGAQLKQNMQKKIIQATLSNGCSSH